jgi:hypothetical protein
VHLGQGLAGFGLVQLPWARLSGLAAHSLDRGGAWRYWAATVWLPAAGADGGRLWEARGSSGDPVWGGGGVGGSSPYTVHGSMERRRSRARWGMWHRGKRSWLIPWSHDSVRIRPAARRTWVAATSRTIAARWRHGPTATRRSGGDRALWGWHARRVLRRWPGGLSPLRPGGLHYCSVHCFGVPAW